MEKDESTFYIDFGFEEEKPKKVEIKEETFISDIAGPKGHLINSHNAHGALRVLHFRCKADKDYKKNTKFKLCRLPQSQVRLLGYISQIYGTVSKFMVGWAEFQNRHRERKPGLEDGIVANGSISEENTILGRTPLESTVFDSLGGVEIYATALSNGKKGDYIEGIFVYVKK